MKMLSLSSRLSVNDGYDLIPGVVNKLNLILIAFSVYDWHQRVSIKLLLLLSLLHRLAGGFIFHFFILFVSVPAVESQDRKNSHKKIQFKAGEMMK